MRLIIPVNYSFTFSVWGVSNARNVAHFSVPFDLGMVCIDVSDSLNNFLRPRPIGGNGVTGFFFAV